MEKIEYGDVNKFLVSGGLVLISLSVAIPYFYLNEDFGLYLESDKIKLFTPSIQDLICEKQKIVATIQNIIPWTSPTLFVIGTISVIIGLVRWFRRQSRIDERDDLDIQKLRLEVKKLTPVETVQKAEQEAESDQLAILREQQRSTITDAKIKSDATSYLDIEQRVINHFKNYKTDNFVVLDNVKVGRFALDILLESNSQAFADRVIEVKYAKTTLSYEMLSATIDRLEQYTYYYSKSNKRKVKAVLLVIYSDTAVQNEQQIRDVSQKINSRASEFLAGRLKWQFIKDTDIEKYDIKEILQR